MFDKTDIELSHVEELEDFESGTCSCTMKAGQMQLSSLFLLIVSTCFLQGCSAREPQESYDRISNLTLEWRKTNLHASWTLLNPSGHLGYYSVTWDDGDQTRSKTLTMQELTMESTFSCFHVLNVTVAPHNETGWEIGEPASRSYIWQDILTNITLKKDGNVTQANWSVKCRSKAFLSFKLMCHEDGKPLSTLNTSYDSASRGQTQFSGLCSKDRVFLCTGFSVAIRQTNDVTSNNGISASVRHHCSLLISTGQDVLVQELLSGCVAAIAADLQLEGSTPSAWLLHALATQAARGLATLHKHGLAHGDIKPHNIMWSADQSTFVLIDFGLSTRVGEHYNHRVHSPEYSSPETRAWNGHIVQQQIEQQRCLLMKLEEVPHLHKETSKSQSTTEDHTPIRPGTAADVWALGYTIARIASGAPIFPDGLPSTQEEADLIVMSRLNKLMTSYEPDFLQDLALYIERCLRLSPNERATAAQLSASWPCAASLQPQYFDLNNLPTSVLRVANVADSSLIAKEEVSDLLALCDSFGDVMSHRIAQSEAGVILVRFSTADSAETAVQHLQRKEWRGRTPVPTFYPLLLYQELATEDCTETG